MKACLLSILLFLHIGVFSQDIPLSLEINNLKNTNGSVIVKVFFNSKAYDADSPNIVKHVPKKGNMKNEVFLTQLLLPKGTYGIAFVDDVNNNKEMDYNLIGMPKEGFGFANFYLKGLSRPDFSDFSFKLTNEIKTIKARLRYL